MTNNQTGSVYTKKSLWFELKNDKLALLNLFVFFSTIAALFLLVGFVLTINPDTMQSSSRFYSAIFEFLKPLIYYSHTHLLIILTALVIAPFAALTGLYSKTLRDSLILIIAFVIFFLVIIQYPQALKADLTSSVPAVFGYGLHFKIDMLSYVFLLLSSTLWLCVTMYSFEYMEHETRQNRFYFFMFTTFAGVLGTIMASDILTLFFFFELMTISSYFLVAHNQAKSSLLASNNYLFMGIIGGLAILLGMLLVLFYANCLDFVGLASQLCELGWIKILISLLFMFGFGVKAGMIPMHVWLPKAHPAAPTPASALLSGLLIKTGTYGLLRLVTSFYMPDTSNCPIETEKLWELSVNFGTLIIWMGIITMAVGVFMALQQGNMKKMLAYHSISQMGYIIMGIGVAAYLAHHGAMGFAGAIYHTINHALFKSLLFMTVGLVYLKTGQLNMYRLGGLRRQMPFAALICLIASFGITGMPFFNGFASKSILHHAIVEAHEHGHSSFYYAEIIFMIVSAGTACSFIKMFYYVFMGTTPEKYQKLPTFCTQKINFAMSLIALIIILIGCFPNFVMDHMIIASARQFAYDKSFISEHLNNMNFFNYSDLIGMIPVYIGGILIFILGRKYNLFHIHLPVWLDFDEMIYKKVYKAVLKSSELLAQKHESLTPNGTLYIFLAVLAAGIIAISLFSV